MPPPATAPAILPVDTDAATGQREAQVSPELEAAIGVAMAQIDRGEYIELTFEELDHWAETGEFPWSDDESLG
jgi:hypothetical protein